MTPQYFYGPFVSDWERLLSHLNRWIVELPPARALNIPDNSDPTAGLRWIHELEHKHSREVTDAALKMAQYPHRQIPEIGHPGEHFLRERIRTLLPVVEGISTTCEQARKPVYLFGVQRYEGLEEQQISWGLVSYWDEFGRNRWYLDQMDRIYYVAHVNGWRPGIIKDEEA